MPGSIMRPVRIISGGQTGIDRAALDTAIQLGIEHGGWCPRGRIAEDGRIDPRYRLSETRGSDYRERTALNVRDSDGTLILNSGPLTGGTAMTAEFARQYNKPCLVLSLDRPPATASFTEWLNHNQVRCLNVAGPRASKLEEAERRAGEYLQALLQGQDQDPVQVR